MRRSHEGNDDERSPVMFQHILVPLDGSGRAEEALPRAAHLARTSQAVLILVQVVTVSTYPSIYPIGPIVALEPEKEAETFLSRLASSESLKGIQVQTQVLIGDPVYTLLVQFAETRHVGLLVMRSHGATGLMRLVMGSVAQQVLRQSLVPVLVIRDGSSPSLSHPGTLSHAPRILIALDGSSLAETALLPAAQLCAALAAPAQGAIHLTRTVQRIVEGGGETNARVEIMNRGVREEAEAYLKRIEHRFKNGDLALFRLTVTSSVVTHVDASDIWKRVVEESECIENVSGSSACDIIAMATHGRHGFQHLLEGSITESVIDGTTHPLLVAHTQKPEVEAEMATTSGHVR